MDFDELLSELKNLNLPQKDFVIFGSGPLAVRKIRESNDLDILAKPDLFDKLSKKYGIKEGNKIRIGNIEIFKDWKPWIENSDEIINSAEIIGNLPFAKLCYVGEWKKKINREKDKKDIKLIESFLKKNQT